MTRVLVLNCGSSSVKYRLFDDASTVDRGMVDRVTPDGYEEAVESALFSLDLHDVTAVGHRVVHGGDRFRVPTLIDDEVLESVRELVPLAPLHNPVNLTGIEVARRLLASIPHVAVFDTAFHQSIPPEGTTYAIDAEVARAWNIRRYGFHGTSHAYVSHRTATLLDRPLETVNTITLHLGNGASASAVAAGRCVATSMGLSPLQGLVMGTRSGDIDPAVLFHLHRAAGLTFDEIDELLNSRSGLKGLCGDNDMRAVLAARAAGDPAASLAFDVYCRRIKEYVGAYAAVLGRLDAVTFTAGVGENSPEVRAAALAGLTSFGINIDEARNAASEAGERLISRPDSPVAVCVIPTDEELEIATQTRIVVHDPAATPEL